MPININSITICLNEDKRTKIGKKNQE